jgi:hypothetical protein
VLHPATGPGPGSLVPHYEQEADPTYIMRDKRIM